MPENKDFALRINLIDECLRNHLQKWTLERLILTVNEKLMDQYGKNASRRTIQDDIKFLKDEKGAPIAKRREGKDTYFFYSNRNFSIKNLPVQEEEISLLKEAISILGQVNEFQIVTEVGEVVKKLENTVSLALDSKPAAIHFEKNSTTAGTQYIDQVFAAINQQACLRIAYQPFHAPASSQSVVHPYLLREYRNRWFLVGRLEGAEKITVMALDRIREIKNSANSFRYNDLFDPATYFNNVIGVTVLPGQQPEEIILRIRARQVPYVLTKPIHYTQQIIEQYSNGDIRIALWLMNNFELRSVLLSYGCDLEVIQPSTLREAMIQNLEQCLEAYR